MILFGEGGGDNELSNFDKIGCLQTKNRKNFDKVDESKKLTCLLNAAYEELQGSP